MPKFNLHCVETFMESCYYYNVVADSLAEALELCATGEQSVDERKNSEWCHWDYLHDAEQDGERISDELVAAACEAMTKKLDDAVARRDPYTPLALNDRELVTVLAALRYWQHDLDHIDDALVLDVADCFTDHTPLTPAEIDALCERLNLQVTAAVSSEGGCDCGLNCNRRPGEACPNDNTE